MRRCLLASFLAPLYLQAGLGWSVDSARPPLLRAPQLEASGIAQYPVRGPLSVQLGASVNLDRHHHLWVAVTVGGQPFKLRKIEAEMAAEKGKKDRR